MFLMKLDEPPAQTRGGGLNSSVSCITAPNGNLSDSKAPGSKALSSIAPGATIDLEFLCGVEQRGHYRVTLSNQYLDLTFEGNTETDTHSRLATAPTRAGADRLGAMLSGRGTPRGIGAQGAQQAGGSGRGATSGVGANALLTAVLIFEGNTEDGVQQNLTVKPSSLNSSSISADKATGAIGLRFNGSLDAETATDATRYTVVVNGQAVAVESAAYDAARSSVVLALPTGILHQGDTVRVEWNNLVDAQGRSVAGQAGPVKVH